MGTPAETAYKSAAGREGRITDLVTTNLALVTRIVDRLSVSLDPAISREDLISAGALGLVQAAHRFDPSKSVKFGTFAYPRIRGAVIDFLRQNDWLTKSARKGLGAVRECAREFRSRRGRGATIEELARGTGMSEQDVLKYLSYEKWDHIRSLQDQMDSDKAGVMADRIRDDSPSPLETLERQEQIERVAKAIQGLPQREKQIIVMYYYEDLYMTEMADILGISESRVSQLHTRALYNLTRKLEEL